MEKGNVMLHFTTFHNVSMYVKCPQKLVMQIVKANFNYVNLHTESMLQDRRHYTVLKKTNEIINYKYVSKFNRYRLLQNIGFE